MSPLKLDLMVERVKTENLVEDKRDTTTVEKLPHHGMST